MKRKKVLIVSTNGPRRERAWFGVKTQLEQAGHVVEIMPFLDKTALADILIIDFASFAVNGVASISWKDKFAALQKYKFKIWVAKSYEEDFLKRNLFWYRLFHWNKVQILQAPAVRLQNQQVDWKL